MVDRAPELFIGVVPVRTGPPRCKHGGPRRSAADPLGRYLAGTTSVTCSGRNQSHVPGKHLFAGVSKHQPRSDVSSPEHDICHATNVTDFTSALHPPLPIMNTVISWNVRNDSSDESGPAGGRHRAVASVPTTRNPGSQADWRQRSAAPIENWTANLWQGARRS
jgi:hypothetical protein